MYVLRAICCRKENKRKQSNNRKIVKYISHMSTPQIHEYMGFDAIRIITFFALSGGYWHFWMLGLPSHLPKAP